MLNFFLTVSLAVMSSCGFTMSRMNVCANFSELLCGGGSRIAQGRSKKEELEKQSGYCSP